MLLHPLKTFHRALCLSVLMLCLAVGQAAAHAVLLDREPAEGTAQAQSPQQLVLRFDEPVTPVSLRLIDASGHLRAGPDGAVARGDTLSLALPALEAGRYVVSYRVISADSHPVGGSYVFSVGDVASGTEPRPAADAPLWWSIASVSLHGVVLALTLTLAGFTFWPSQPSQRRRALIGAAIATVLIAVTLGVDGGLATDTPGVTLLDPAVWRVGLNSVSAATALGSAVGLAVLSVGLLLSWRFLAIGGGLIIAASYLLSGHVVSAPPIWLSRPALVIHILCAAAWIGALPLLVAVLTTAPASRTAHILRRFSRSGIALVLGLIGSGAAMTWVQAGSPRFLILSKYGAVLLLKLAFVSGATVIAWCNRTRRLPALEAASPDAASGFIRAIRTQIDLIAGVFLITALLTAQVPPRSLFAEAQRTQHTAVAHLSNQHAALDLTLTPNANGAYAAAVRVSDIQGRSFTPLGVTLRLSLPSRQVEPIVREIAATGGQLAMPELVLPISGEWQVEASVLLTEFTETTLHGVIRIEGGAP